MNAYCEIRQSSIDGVGLFSKVFIKKGTKIHDYNGVEYTLSHFKIKYENDISYCYVKRRANIVLVGKDEPYRTNNLSHFCNESLTPNCVFKKSGLYTLCDIEPNTECFLLYPKYYVRSYSLQ